MQLNVGSRIGYLKWSLCQDAIEDTVDEWSTLREYLIEAYLHKQGDTMICALTHDNPTHDC